MRAFTFLSLIFFLLLVCLAISVFVLPIGYTYDETCPKCQGKGIVTCEACNGTGRCWLCNGTGITAKGPGVAPLHPIKMICHTCAGTGICIICGGLGQHACRTCGGTGVVRNWMYNLTGATVVLSTISIFLFLGFLGSAYAYMSHAKHNKKWSKKQTTLSLILAICFAILLFTYLSPNQITQEVSIMSALFSIMITSLFSFIFHKSYTTKLKT